MGFGIEKVSEEVKKYFHNVSMISLSSDNINNHNFSKTLDKIEKGKIKIIIGTQIISKGFNFLKLNLESLLLIFINFMLLLFVSLYN